MPRRPEILAPAGDHDALAAALAAGADAVYFGLDDGFNARARAENFPSARLAEVVAWVHRAGARVYIALNTLVFEPELPIIEQLVRRVAASGADAIIVQDPAVALLARAVCPALEIHASTQMTASSPLAVEVLRSLGLSRVVVPRELSVADIRAYKAGISADHGVELEVFVHGALCIAWSGQCLSSEAWGGRSANRGQCAQACRLPYELVVDGDTRDLGDVAYLLSPKDLAALELVPALADAGVAALKIEGRLKGPSYVATAVAQYRTAVDAFRAPGEPRFEPSVAVPLDPASLHVAYSRGISAGFLGGVDHQTLVEGRFPRHRGLPLGRVTLVQGDELEVVADPAQRPHTGNLAARGSSPLATDARGSSPPPDARGSSAHAPDARGSSTLAPDARGSSPPPDTRDAIVVEPIAGMGVVFDAGTPERAEQGGPIFAVARTPSGYRLRFGQPGPDLGRVRPGDFVWVSSDPRVTSAGQRASDAGRGQLGRIALDVVVSGTAGQPLDVRATIRSRADQTTIARIERTAADRTAGVRSASVLAAARGAGLTRELLVDKLAAFGGTPFRLGELDTSALEAALHLPVSELKELRRTLVADLDEQLGRVDRAVATDSAIELVRAELGATDVAATTDIAPYVVPLCRTDAQLDAALDAGAPEVELDWMELVGLARAVTRARTRGAKVAVATLRVQKPGEERIDAHLARLEPDGVLVRSWGSLAYFAREAAAPAGAAAPVLHGDFSLNVTNSITAAWVLRHGLATLTAAHDLDRDQLAALVAAVPRGRIAVTLHHHIPTFHTEHCVYAHLLSDGRDYRTCGRPCERHQIALRDRVGLVHPVNVDVGCRNTVFNAQAQSAASGVAELVASGVRRFRIELVRESAAETARVYDAYVRLVSGAIAASEVVRIAAVHEQFGVTRGTMRTLTVLR